MKITGRDVSRAPDLIFILTEHLDRLHQTYLGGPADLVIEVISPGTAADDRGEEFEEYPSAGVPEYWLIDPRSTQADFYRLNDAGLYVRMPTDAGIFRGVTLDGYWIEVDWLWQDPRPPVFDTVDRWGIR